MWSNAQPQEQAFKSFQENYNEYLRGLDGIWTDTSQRVTDAQRSYLERCSQCAIQQDQQKAQEIVAEAYQTYARAVRNAWDSAQKAYSDAYIKFLDGHRNAWGRAELSELTPGTVSAVAASASAAAAYAGATIGNWSLIAYAGVPQLVLATMRTE